MSGAAWASQGGDSGKESPGSGLVHWDDLRDWMGRVVDGGGYTLADSCECMAKTVTIL